MKDQKKVLIIEDEQSLRAAVVAVLKTKNILPIEAVNGEEGVKKALSEHPDLILLDLIMPVMDGMTALKEIRKDKWGANVPVVILTNLSATEESIITDIVTHKPMEYLVKSDWKIHDVIDKVEKILNK